MVVTYFSTSYEPTYCDVNLNELNKIIVKMTLYHHIIPTTLISSKRKTNQQNKKKIDSNIFHNMTITTKATTHFYMSSEITKLYLMKLN